MWGLLGLGAFGISHVKPPEGQRIIVTTRSHGNELINSAVSALQPTDVLRVGGAGHKVLLIIEGKAHAYVYPRPGCKKWDTCAPEALLASVGGKLTDVFGKAYEYHRDVQLVNAGGVLATYDANEAHQWYCERIPQEVREALFVPNM